MFAWFTDSRAFKSLRSVFLIHELRGKLWWTFVCIFVYRIGFQVPVPGVRNYVVEALAADAAGTFGSFLGLVNMVSGGDLMNASLFSLGIMPYISASIIFSLLTKVIRPLEELSKRPDGRRKITQYTRYATLPLCLFQGGMVLSSIVGQKVDLPSGVPDYIVDPDDTTFFVVTSLLAWTMGTMFLVWLGEQISEYGIGNGASVIIMCGILARLPSSMWRLLGGATGGEAVAGESENLTKLVVFLAMLLGTVLLVVLITRGKRLIPIRRQGAGMRGNQMVGSARPLPLRVNHAGVMPVIFASALLILPSMLFAKIGEWLYGNEGDAWKTLASGFNQLADALGYGNFWYCVVYILAIFFFSKFWTQLFFNPQEIADNLKKQGFAIPGMRPGERTRAYLTKVLGRITLVGSVFLCVIALLPTLMAQFTQMEYELAAFVGGTSLLIMVSVALDVIDKIDIYLEEHRYERLGGK